MAEQKKLEITCKNCGRVGKPKVVIQGNMPLEFILYLFLFVPGVVYTLWRCSNYHLECPKCSNMQVIKNDERLDPEFTQRVSIIGLFGLVLGCIIFALMIASSK